MSRPRDGAWWARRIGTIALGSLACFAFQQAQAEEPTELKATIKTVEPTEEQIVVPVDKSALIDLNLPITRAQVASAEIADVAVVTPQQLVVTGKKFGATQLIISTEDGQRKVFDVLVKIDTAALMAALREAAPHAKVEAQIISDKVVLRGEVRDAETAARLEAIAKLFATEEVLNHLHVVGEQQVLLRVTVAEVNKTALRELGVNGFLAGDDFTDVFFLSNIGQVNPSFISATLSPATGTIPFVIGAGGNTINGGIPISDSVDFSIGFPRVQLQIFFRALREDRLLRVLAEPNLVAISGREASFVVGGEVPVPVPQGLGQVTIEFHEFGIRLRFVPTVLGDQIIRLHVQPEVSDLDPVNSVVVQGVRTPAFTTRRAETTVEMGNGQTLAIGGLLSEQTRGVTQKLPGLGDLPVLGALFRSVSYQRSVTELMILVTPEIVSAMNPDQVPPVPGEDLSIPNDWQLYGLGLLEGEPVPRPPDPIAALEADASAARAAASMQPTFAGIHGPWGMSGDTERTP